MSLDSRQHPKMIHLITGMWHGLLQEQTLPPPPKQRDREGKDDKETHTRCLQNVNIDMQPTSRTKKKRKNKKRIRHPYMHAKYTRTAERKSRVPPTAFNAEHEAWSEKSTAGRTLFLRLEIFSAADTHTHSRKTCKTTRANRMVPHKQNTRNIKKQARAQREAP